MYYPDKNTFIELAKKGNLISVYKEILADTETPVSSFLRFKDLSHAFLLESVEGGERLARYSFIGINPKIVFRSVGKAIEIVDHGRKTCFEAKIDPLDELKKIMAMYRVVENESLPRFFGGAVGYVGYDMVKYFETVEIEKKDTVGIPDCYFMLTDTILIFDHVNHTIKVTANAYISPDETPEDVYDGAIKKIEELLEQIAQPMPISILEENPVPRKLEIQSNMEQSKYEEIVRRTKEYIKAGDIIQGVLSQRLQTKIDCTSFDVYRALRSVNPSPYMYYLKFDDIDIVGSSPEMLVRCEKDAVTVRPIAGTFKRGKDDAEDNDLAEKLLADPKERAEHIMLVDLGRNDIGRVCEMGSVSVTDLMLIERYSHVMHIVSNVEGKLAEGKDQFDVLRAVFPAGTVSGAPKIRAMEIIEELEPTKRGPYAGAILYFGFSGNLDSCITIRTIVVKDNIAYIQAGAGIVADSVPEKEYQETLNKAGAMLKALEKAQMGGVSQ
ncbi:MAG: anthranilate synthase component I [Candidatus Ancaeobacter aquaticus]|nr:anthranilate synthase component I [Candidatus Ancaeobacter aquaticus]